MVDVVIALGLVALSAWIIARACDGFETAADYLGRNLSEGVKGASINAVGSSMPELFTTFVFLFFFRDTTGFAGGIGTTAGSAVFNSMIIPAGSILAALWMFKIATIKVSRKVLLRDGLMLIAAEFVLIVTIGTTLEWWHGVMLMLIYAGYAGYMFVSMKNNNATDEEQADDDSGDDEDGDAGRARSRLVAFFKLDLETAIIADSPLRKGNAWVLLSVATVIIAVACYVLVFGCETFGKAVGIHGYFVAVILAAAASSVPDTILSIKDARKGNYDDAVSNALGSNIFDICVALGLPLFLFTVAYGPIEMPVEIRDDVSELRILLLGLTILAFAVFILGRGMGKGKAWILLGIYALFTAFVVGRAYEAAWAMQVADVLHAVQGFIQGHGAAATTGVGL